MYFEVEYFELAIMQYYDEVKDDIEREKNIIKYYLSKIDDIEYVRDEDSELLSRLSEAFVITIYGRYEYLINILCEVVQRELGLGISYKDIKKYGINQAVFYLEKTTGISIEKHSSYKTIDKWRKLRNVLAHNYGVYKESDIEKFKQLGIYCSGETYTVFVTKNDCMKLFDDFDNFVEYLFSSLLALCRNEHYDVLAP
ncbi:hypothetical protein [Desulfuribacillus alkaliarsenatis]|uniref:MAE-28990/MAE-18760-like HEPN domain-containing protein n=1 Tax=Desulfuribacillus alkaliarsenatis TaxID=766136 RepID=A0A1E5FYX8_9FIRM|nr:hypothetical protein [Desulfuribacillus alkaliarsenatis]OEF95647.1 hypothetical protein BHF68_12445 [Desulfuribacillus alkaliarsenatis]